MSQNCEWNMKLKWSNMAHTEASSFLALSQEVLNLADSSQGTWPTTISLSSQGTQQNKLDNCSNWWFHTLYDNVTGLSEMLYCNQAVYQHERVEFEHETAWPLHSSIDSSWYQIRLNNIKSIYFQLIDNYLPEAIFRHHHKTFLLRRVGFQNLMGFKYSVSGGVDTCLVVSVV